MAIDPRLIRESFALVEDNADRVGSHLYALLFLEEPALRDMFPPMMDTQRGRLMNAVARIAYQTDDPDELTEYLQQLGRDHRRFGVRPEHYAPLVRCLIASMRRFAKPGWTQEMDEAWLAVFRMVSGTMISAAEEAARTSPAWWTGRVVDHELRTGSIAVITVRPDQPYPFRAGQYAAVETLRWPRVWRAFSFANAPRRDGLLSFHVRAVDGGWVSSALVHHTRVGDALRIGPAMGSMVVDQASGRDILMVGGGTGIAPLLALTQELGRWNAHRQVHLFYGARKPEDLYAMPVLEQLQRRHPWLTVVPCVSHDPRYRGENGMLPDVVAEYGSRGLGSGGFGGRDAGWATHETYLSGSLPMLQASLSRLVESGVPARRIHFDAYGEQAEILLGARRAEQNAMQPTPPARPVEAAAGNGNGAQPAVPEHERLGLGSAGESISGEAERSTGARPARSA